MGELAKVPELLVAPSEVVMAQEKANLDVAVSTAKAYPRTISRVKERVLELATCDQETAEACFYALKREGKLITGPSVRLAEIVAASYGNLRVVSRIVAIDATMVTAQAVAQDMEVNYTAGAEVKRRITNKEGRRYSDDMIVVTANAAASIAARNALFKVVPVVIFRKEFAKIHEVSGGDAKTLTQARAVLLSYFETTWKVKPDRVLAAIDRRTIEDVTLEDMTVLRGVATALKDGETTPDEAFPTAQAPNGEGGALKAGRHSVRKPDPAASQPPQATPAGATPNNPQDAAGAPTQAPGPAPEAVQHNMAVAAMPLIADARKTVGEEAFSLACKCFDLSPMTWERGSDANILALLTHLRALPPSAPAPALPPLSDEDRARMLADVLAWEENSPAPLEKEYRAFQQSLKLKKNPDVSKVTPEILVKVHEWVLAHPLVQHPN